MKIMFAFILLVFIFLPLNAEIVLPKILTDNMVLQREKQVAIWGTASVGEKITVKFAGQIKSTKTDKTGNWRIKLDAMKATIQPQNMTILGSNTLIIKNIVVGDVWLCSGQSNMEYPLDRMLHHYIAPAKCSDSAAIVLRSKRNPLVRFLYVEHKLAPILPTLGWKESSDSTLKFVSAVGYFFADNLAKQLNIPIGIISSSWGGTRVEQWTPFSAYQTSPIFKDSTAGKSNFKIDGLIPGKMFEGMIHPLIPYTLKGIIWYQGESNVMIHDTATFVAKTKLMLDTWKSLWNDPTLFFNFVQIAPYHYSKRKDKLKHGTDLLPYYWENQAKCLAFPRAGMTVTTDLVDNLNNIHPSYKWEVGRRLARCALAKSYGQKIVYSGPIYQNMKILNHAIELNFKFTGSGLKSSDHKPLTWFSIAGKDRKFFPAHAEIRGNKVIVNSKNVPFPVAVRFGWDESAMPNFCNNEKLPASPFRTDHW